MAQSVVHPTFGFGSGCDLRAMRLSPKSASMLSTESPRDSLPLPPELDLSRINQSRKKEREREGGQKEGKKGVSELVLSDGKSESALLRCPTISQRLFGILGTLQATEPDRADLNPGPTICQVSSLFPGIKNVGVWVA